MRIWLVTTGEPLPTDEGARLMRHGILAEQLAGHGHEVLWWNSTFDHQRKQHRFQQDTTLEIRPAFRIRLLHAAAYRKNISVARIRNHRAIATQFRRQCESEPAPDVILCAFPTIELSAAVVEFGRRHGIPVILDVRDMWPDILLNVCPPGTRWAGVVALQPLFRQTRYAFKHAAGLLSVSEGMLRWALEISGRQAAPQDRTFPLGYRRTSCSPEKMETAGQALRDAGVGTSRRICWFVGQFGMHYDVSTVIEAARLCETSGLSDVQFVLSGDGDQYANLVKQAAGLTNVVFTGWVATPQIAYLMSVASAGLVAINHKNDCNLPNKLFEYFSAGLPVLSSLPGEAAELLAANDCGVTYRTGDAADCVEKLKDLLRDETRLQQMGANAFALYQEQFSADVVYSGMESYLIEMAGDGGGGRTVHPLGERAAAAGS